MAGDLVGRARVLLEADTRGFNRDMDAAEAHAHKTGRALKAGLAVGVAGAAASLYALGKAAKIGFGEFEQGQRVAAQTNAVIKSTGGAAKVTAKEVDALSQSLMKKSGVDDEVIKSGANMLLTFTNIRNETGKGNDIFNQSTKTLLDMSVALGQDMPKSAIQLGKALNDPIKGVTALQRVGVTFTAAQKEQIKTLEETGHHLDAQKIILRELTKEFGGSAAAAGQTFGGQLSILRERLNNFLGDAVGKAIPTLTHLLHGFMDFLPTLEEFGKRLLDRVGPALKTVGEVMGVVFDFIKTDGLPIWKELAEIVSTAVTRIGAVVQAHMPEIQKVFKNLGTIIQNLWAIAGPILRLLFEEVLPRVIGIAIFALEKISGIIVGLARVFRASVGFIIGMLDKFLGGIQLLAEGASHLPFIGKHFDGIANAIGGVRVRLRELKSDIETLKGKTVPVTVNLRYSSNAPGRPGDGIIGADGIVPIVERDVEAMGRYYLTTSGGRTSFAGVAANPGGLSPWILDDLALGQSYGLTMTSGYRPGAITSSGNKSLHSVGQAIDMAGSPSSMAQYARAEAGRSGVAEVIYTPVGWWHPGSGWGRVTDATIARGHYSHVHVGVRGGDGTVGTNTGDGSTYWGSTAKNVILAPTDPKTYSLNPALAPVAPAPAVSDPVQGIYSGTQVSQGQRVYASVPSDLDTSGGWGVLWAGPGWYIAVKMAATTAGGQSNTVWILESLYAGSTEGEGGFAGGGGIDGGYSGPTAEEIEAMIQERLLREAEGVLSARSRFNTSYAGNIFSPGAGGLQPGSTSPQQVWYVKFEKPPPDSYSWVRSAAFAAGR